METPSCCNLSYDTYICGDVGKRPHNRKGKDLRGRQRVGHFHVLIRTPITLSLHHNFLYRFLYHHQWCQYLCKSTSLLFHVSSSSAYIYVYNQRTTLFEFTCGVLSEDRTLLSSSRCLYICVQSANNVVRVYFRKTKQSVGILLPFTWPIKIFLISHQPVINVVLTSFTSVFSKVMVERHWLPFKYATFLLRRSSNVFLARG